MGEGIAGQLVKAVDVGHKPYPNDDDRWQLFRYGFSFPYLGIRFVFSHRELIKWAVIPVIINCSLIIGAFWGASVGAPIVVGEFWPHPSGGFALTMWNAVVMLVGLALFLVGAVFLYVLSGLLATPFYDFLSQQVEFLKLGDDGDSFTWSQFFIDVRQSIAHSVLAICLWVVVMSSLFCVGLIPVIGPVLELGLAIFVTSLFLSREMMDGCMSRRRFTFAYKVQVVRSRLWVMVGFGVACAMLLWIPLLNFVFMPVSIVGGTLLFLSIEEQGLSPIEGDK